MLANDEHYFPGPFTFHPERWLGDTKNLRDTFMPFSLGPRGCAGKAMAYLEIFLVVAKMMWYFDFKPAMDTPEISGAGACDKAHARVFQLLNNFTASHDGPYLEFQRRGDFCRDFDTPKAQLVPRAANHRFENSFLR